MTVNTRVIRILLHNNNTPHVEIQEGLRIQVLPDVSYLARCQKHQFAAFIADQGILVVWDDEPRKVLSRVERLETALMDMIWGDGPGSVDDDDKKDSKSFTSTDGNDLESASEKPRQIFLMQSWLTAATIALTTTAVGAGWRQVAIEVLVDKSFMRLLFVFTLIPQFWLALVRCLQEDKNLMHTNSRPVLLSSARGKYRPDHRSHKPNEPKHKILLWHRSEALAPGER